MSEVVSQRVVAAVVKSQPGLTKAEIVSAAREHVSAREAEYALKYLVRRGVLVKDTRPSARGGIPPRVTYTHESYEQP